MNYFAHGCRFVDRPEFLIGTAIPDMIRVSDPGVRVRSKHIVAFLGSLPEDVPSASREVAEGIRQHLNDDDLFHNSVSFLQLSALLSQNFRHQFPEGDGMRPSFLGHIVTELVLDALLIERFPSTLHAYYRALSQVDPQSVQEIVGHLATSPPTRLGEFIPSFHREQFLWDYRTPEGMLYRLNQVMRRVKLEPLPSTMVEYLREVRPLVEQHMDDLLVFPTAELPLY